MRAKLLDITRRRLEHGGHANYERRRGQTLGLARDSTGEDDQKRGEGERDGLGSSGRPREKDRGGEEPGREVAWQPCPRRTARRVVLLSKGGRGQGGKVGRAKWANACGRQVRSFWFPF